MMVKPATSPAIKLGRTRFYVIGPGRSELKKLREEWKIWPILSIDCRACPTDLVQGIVKQNTSSIGITAGTNPAQKQ
jgi:hypothetical protein